MIESIVSVRCMADDHNGAEGWRCERALLPGEEDVIQHVHSQRVLAIKDMWDTLVGVHSQLSHGGRQRMERYLIEHGTHVPQE